MAAVALERSTDAAVIVDVQGVVRGVTSAMEPLLGEPREVLLGRPLAELVVPDHAAGLRGFLAQSLRGLSQRWTGALPAEDDGERTVELDARRVGHGAAAAVILTVQRVGRPSVPPRARSHCPDVYDIDTAPGRFGIIRQVLVGSHCLPDREPVGQRCYAVFRGRPEPCGDCPALALSQDLRASQITVRTWSENEGEELPYFAITVARVGPDRARVSMLRVGEGTRSKLVEARVSVLAQRAGLTEREREVFQYLLLGRASEDIAELLDISPRTVRFHQHNLLDKLGAESRADLLRLVL